MKRFVFAASFMGLFLLVASVALGHGGQYTGPAGSGSGGGFAPAGGGTPGPGGAPAGGVTPGGGTTGGSGGSTGGDSGGSGGGGTGPTGPGGSGGTAGGTGGAVGGGTTGGQRKKAESDANLTWGAWWFFNDDKYLNLKARIRAQETETDNADIFMGESGVDNVNRVPAKKIREKVNPVLQFALKDPYYDTRAAAVIALGKTGFQESDLPFIESVLDDDDKRVRESSCLAMGLLGDKAAIPTLIAIMNDTPAARRRLGRGTSDVLPRTRAFASISIGLIGARDSDLSNTEAVPALLAMLKQKVKHRDLHIGPILALGLMKSNEAVPTLIEFMNDPENNDYARGYAATSLGKIGDPSAIPHLVKGLRDKQNVLVQSSAIALGMLTNEDDKRVVNALQKMVKSGRDLGAKNFSIIALGEIGGESNRSFLFRSMQKGNTTQKTFAAIALAVYFNKYENDPFRLEACREIHKILKAEKSPIERGAYAIALGIMRYTEAGPDLLAILKDGGEASMRQHMCVAMGLMGYSDAIKTIRDVVIERGDTDLRRNAAIALGLLGDKEAMDHLRKEMENSSNSLPVLGAVTQGLGFIGDVSAVETLNKMVQDRKQYKDVTRAFSAVALGLLGDKDPIPFLSRIAANNNYLARTEALGEILTIL